MLTVGEEHRDPMEIIVGGKLYAVTFSPDGECMFSGGDSGVQVWRVKDGKPVATMEAELVRCLAVSNDGRWIAAGTVPGDVHVWDAKTYNQVFVHRVHFNYVNGVDFSPDSTRLVSASSNGTAAIYIATSKQVHMLCHDDWVFAAKYSPQGDRIAIATLHCVRVYDSNDGRLLVEIKVKLTPLLNTALVWFNNHLLVVSDGKIKQFEASTGSAVSEWPVPDTNRYSCIALPKHGEFVAYSAGPTVTLWDTATHTELGLRQHSQRIHPIALSPDSRLLAIGGEDGKITINSLSWVTVRIVSH